MRRITVSQGVAIIIALLGLYVMFGWVVGSETIVHWQGSVAMGFNTALLFVAAAVCLTPTLSRTKFSWLSIFCAWLLILLPSAILFEHLFDINLGIDWVSLHSLIIDNDTTHPGRSSPNACLGFLFAGITFCLASRAKNNKTFQIISKICAVGILVIGVAGVLGYILKLEALYRLAEYNRMAVSTAMGMSLMGIGVWSWLRQASWNTKPVNGDDGITQTAALVLTIVVIISGITGFAVLKQGFEESMSETVFRTTKNNAAAFASTIDHHLTLAHALNLRPALQRHMIKLNSNPYDKEALKLINEVGKSFLPSGLSGIRFFNAQGQLLETVGTMVREKAVMAMKLQTPHHHVILLWQDGFVLWKESTVVSEGRVLGKIITEQRLPELTEMLRDIAGHSPSTDIIICGRSSDNAICFPSRFYPANMVVPMFKDGKPYLAASRALLNQKGVLIVKDLRGISVLAGYAPVSNFGLSFVYKTDTSELYTPIRERFNLLAFLVIALVAIGTLVLHMQVKPLAGQLLKEQRRMQVILESSHEAFIGMDQKGLITDWNAEAQQTFGWAREEVMGKKMAEIIIPPALRDKHNQGMARFLQTGEGPVFNKRIELLGLHRSGREFPVEITISAIQTDGSYSFTAFLHDISDRKEAERLIQESQTRLKTITDNMPALIAYIDRDERYRFNNKTYSDWLGHDPDQLFGKTVKETVGEIGYQQIEPYLHRALNGETVTFERSMPNHKGELRHSQATYLPHFDEAGEVIGIYGMVFDITERKQMELQLHYQATHDTLTELPNRSEFMSRLEQAIYRSDRNKSALALLYLDIDNFKQINDTLGHEAGDELLKKFARLLEQCVRKTDLVARLAGDEFTIIIEGIVNEKNAELVAEKIINAMSNPISIPGSDELITSSIGVAILQTKESREALLARADAAMYVAKKRGKNQIAIASIQT